MQPQFVITEMAKPLSGTHLSGWHAHPVIPGSASRPGNDRLKEEPAASVCESLLALVFQ